MWIAANVVGISLQQITENGLPKSRKVRSLRLPNCYNLGAMLGSSSDDTRRVGNVSKMCPVIKCVSQNLLDIFLSFRLR
jgi:hypothetical protein